MRTRSTGASPSSSSAMSSSGSDHDSDDAAHSPSQSSDAASLSQRRRSAGDRQQRRQAARQQRHAHPPHRPNRQSASKPSSSSLWRTREKQFEAFRASTIVLPVPPSVVRVDKARGYSLQIMSALHWVLPDAIVRSSRHSLTQHSDSESSGSGSESSNDDSHELLVTLGVHVSLFHAATKRFFGNTWVSPELALDPFMIEQVRHSSDQTLQYVVEHVVLNFRAYFLSDVVDATCVGVVELVAYEKDPDSKATISVVGCGWTLLPLFAAPSTSANASSKTLTAATAPAFTIGASSGESVNVFCGSPRVLWELPSTQWHAQPKQDACKLYYQLVQYDPLVSIAMVLRKHELVGALDPIPGLKHANLANIDVGTNPKVLLLRDDGDTSYADALATFVKLASLVPKSISLAESFTLRVCASTVAVHLRDEVEANLVARLQVSRARLHAGAASIHGEVSARVLKLALHNGRCYRTRIHTIALKAEQPGSDHLRCVTRETKLPGFVLHAHMAIVVQLQFTVHFRITWPPKVKQQAIDAKKPLPPEEDVVLVTIGTRTLVPSDGKKLYLYDKQHAATAAASEPLVLASAHQDANTGGGGQQQQREQQRRVLHVELLSGAPCRPYSDHALYTPPQHHGRKALEKQGLALHDSIAFVDLQLAVDGNGTTPLATSPVHDTKAPVSPAKSPQRRTNQSDSDASDSGDGATHAATHWAAKMLGKADKNAVLAQTLNALATSEARPSSPVKQGTPSNQDPAPPGSPAKQNAPPPSPRRTDPVPLLTPHTRTSELSRASKTLLTRHGFLDAHDTSATNHEHASSSPSKVQHRRLDLRVIPQAPKTLDAELRDVYRAHEVRFHFAAYRALSGTTGSPLASRVPARVYFTFQFYTFAPTRTETLRLSKPFASGSSDSATFLLMRESPASKPSLAIQFDVDTTAMQDPLAPRHFAEYLMHQRLYVDVWDADSLFQLGTCALPLHELLRQGSGIKKFQAEVDVVEPIDSTSWDSGGDGDRTEPCIDVVSPRGRAVVAKVQFLMSNYGLKGRYVVPATATAVVTPAPQSLLSRSGPTAPPPARVKHRVRARPLVDSNAELYRLLSQEGFYGNDERSTRHRGHQQTRSSKQRTRGLSDATSLSPAEVAILCDLFGATRRVPNTATATTQQTRSARIKCDLNGKSGLLALLAVTPVQPQQQSSVSSVVTAPGPSDPNRVAPATPVTTPPVTAGPHHPPPNALHVDRLARVLALVQANQVGLDRAFALFDANGDGFLTHSEFLEALRSMGTVFADVSDADVLAIAAAMDANHDGQVDYKEFTTFLTVQTSKKTQQPHAKTAMQWRDDIQRILLRALDKGIAVHKIFREFDASGDGSLSYDEFAKALQKLGVPPELATTHCTQLLQSFDTNNDGHVSFTEFLTSLGIALDGATQATIVQDTVEDIETIVRETLRRVAAQGVELAQVFAHFDTDKSGKLSIAEFTQALTQLLEPASASASTSANPVRALEQTAISTFVTNVNANGDSEIDYREFLTLCGVSGRALEQQTELYSASDRVLAEKKLIKLLVRALQSGLSIERIFDHFDTNADGKITITEFQSALDKLFGSGNSGLGTSDETAKMIAAKFDADGDREVSLHEFQSFGREIARQQHTLVRLLQSHMSKLTDVAALTPALALGKWQQLCTKDLKLTRQDMDALKPLLVYFDLVDVAKKVDVMQLCGLLKPATDASAPTRAEPKDDPMTRLRALLQKASAMGFDAPKLFGEFDANGDGEVSMAEFKSLLDKLGCFADVSDGDQEAMLALVDKDGSGKLSMTEFTLLLGESSDQVAPTSKTSKSQEASKTLKAVISSDALLKRFTSLLQDAVTQGVDVLKCFAHFDKDSGGQISKREFIDGMQQLGLGVDANDEATLSAIFSSLDRDGSGEISMTEFKQLFIASSGGPERQEKQQSPREPTKPVDSAPSVSTPAAPDAIASPSASSVEPSAKDRLRALLQLAEQNGHDVSVCFSHFDADGDGKITRAEFAQGMKALPGFESVLDDELLALVAALDDDASDSVSLDEFRTFMRATSSSSLSVSAVASEMPTQSQEPHATASGTATDAKKAADASAEPLQDSKDDVVAAAAIDAPSPAEPSGSPRDDANESKAASAEATELVKRSEENNEQPAAAAEPLSETEPAPQPRTLGAKKPGAPTRSASFATPKGKPPPSFAAQRAKTDSATVAAVAASDQVSPDAAPAAVDGSATASTDTNSDKAAAAAARSGKTPLQRTPSSSFAAARAAKAAAVKAAKAATASSSSTSATEPVSTAVASGLDKLRTLLVRAQEQGVALEDSFQHFDSQKTGCLTYDALAVGLKTLGPDFAQLSERDVVEMATALDQTHAGHIALDDFAQLVKAPSPVEGAAATLSASAPSAAATEPRASAGTELAKPSETTTVAAPEAAVKRTPVSARASASDRTLGATQAPVRRTSSFRPSVKSSSTTTTAASAAAADATTNASASTTQAPVARMTSLKAGTRKPLASSKSSDSAAVMAPVMPSSAPSATAAAAPLADSTAPLSSAPGPSEPVDLVTNCAYTFHTDPHIRAVELKLRRAAVDAYTRGVLPHRVVAKFLNHDDTGDRQRKRTRDELLRVEFLQVLMELGFSLLSDPYDASIDSLGSGTLDNDDNGSGARVGPATTRLNDHLYARQLERLARYKHHVRDASKAQKQLVRAVTKTKRTTQQATAEASLQRFADEKSQLLRVLSYYRDGQKKALVYGLIRDHVTTTIALAPHVAALLFLELPFANPYGHYERFRIEIAVPVATSQSLATGTGAADSELLDVAIVKSDVEWTYYREHLPLAYGGSGDGQDTKNRRGDRQDQKAPARVEHEMIDDANEVVMDANDRIAIPLRLRWLDTRRSVHNTSTAAPPVRASVVIRSCTHGHTVALFKLELSPQPLVCHRVLRFSHPGNSIWRVRLRCPRGKCVVCLDPRVAVDTSQSATDNSVGLKCRVGAYPALEEFYVVLYDDEYFARIYEVWHVRIQAKLRLDVHAVLGQRVTSELVIRGDTQQQRQHRHVQCFTPFGTLPLVAFRPAQVFQLVPNAFNRIELAFCATVVPRRSGSSERVLVHLVDVETHELVGAWVVYVALSLPRITKTYDLTLPLAQPAQKKIAYANPWDEPQTIVLRSSAPAQLTPRDTVLELPSNGSAFLRLSFPAMTPARARQSDVYLFINDRKTEQNEECLLFRITYA